MIKKEDLEKLEVDETVLVLRGLLRDRPHLDRESLAKLIALSAIELSNGNFGKAVVALSDGVAALLLADVDRDVNDGIEKLLGDQT